MFYKHQFSVFLQLESHPSYGLPDLFHTGLSDSFQLPILRSFFQIDNDDAIQSSDRLKTHNNLIVI
jgi:hypothetical protein